MKITNFQFTLRQATTKDGYGDNYYVNIDENGATNVSHPYKSIPYKEQTAIFGVIQTAIEKYDEIVEICDRTNRALGLEQYTPTVSSEEIASKSAVPQSCALGDGEVSTGAEVEIRDAPFEEPKKLAQQIEENVIESLGLK